MNAPKSETDAESTNDSDIKKRSPKNRSVNVMKKGYERYESNSPIDPKDPNTFPSMYSPLSDSNMYRIVIAPETD